MREGTGSTMGRDGGHTLSSDTYATPPHLTQFSVDNSHSTIHYAAMDEFGSIDMDFGDPSAFLFAPSPSSSNNTHPSISCPPADSEHSGGGANWYCVIA
ncbi:hypothetical protein EVG20_g5504 [Dentipellis fragilis]|uniref:Uncharacterized protein n=1 Tax=Dentipellis fragilis TaxID=205917 RepID=A0A4Y9YV58_9AGAM|nr:hypothetical protein EVG20_g5504 [Dentipellis fragilis]